MRIQTKILLVFCLVTFILLLLATRPGLFSIDEACYFLMTKSLAENGSLELKNGYDEYPAWQFHILGGEIAGNKMVGKYPPFYPLMALPFFITLGVKGFFLINITAFVLILFILYSYASKILQSRTLALAAVGIYCFCTFSVEYAVAIWPHMTSALLILLSYYLLEIYFSNGEKKILFILACSALIGISIGVRLQNIINYFIIAILLLLFSKRRFASLLLFSCGIFISVSVMSFVNLYRFGSPDPFSYGSKRNLGFYFKNPQVIVFLILCIAALYFIFHFRDFLFINRKRTILIGSIALFFIVIIIATKLSAIAYYMPRMFYHNLVTYSGYFISTYPRSETGGIIFNNIIKKSLLQSCPYLILAFTAPFLMKRFSDSRRTILTLSTAFFCPLIFISSFLFQGGFCFNCRYAFDIIPFGILLSLQFLRNIELSRKQIILPFIIFLFLLITFRWLPYRNIFRQYIILFFPLLLAIALLTMSILLLKLNRNKAVKSIFLFFLFLSFFYSTIVCVGEDLVASLRYRKTNLNVTLKMDKIIPDNSLILMGVNIPLRLILLEEKKNIRIARSEIQEIDYHREMIDFFMKKGSEVYFFSTLECDKFGKDVYRQEIEDQLGKYYDFERLEFKDYLFYHIYHPKKQVS